MDNFTKIKRNFINGDLYINLNDMVEALINDLLLYNENIKKYEESEPEYIILKSYIIYVKDLKQRLIKYILNKKINLILILFLTL